MVREIKTNDFQPQCVYWDGERDYFIFAEGIIIGISWQEANRLVFVEGWDAEAGNRTSQKEKFKL